ncbi:LysE family translocator [Streptomyces sp. AJS327]|uniref:LysE family translocator n=1 Tax=Streptomyces sp. AJS327 TaxID=2545265 RepID=UPI0015DE866D|nr:LysE family translocator [Streptomyces sp. AJS327]MBA0050944.1 LysE family translocator [Streptomyces sp. AJS327]
MIPPHAVLGFLVALLPLVATPGASLALLLRHTAGAGRRRAVPVILGTATGIHAHALLALAGLSALVLHSSRALTAVRLLGAAYLVALGLWTWCSARKPPGAAARRPAWWPDSAYTQATLANVLNPKAAAVYLTLVPQFLVPDRPLGGQILTLAAAHALLVAAWLGVWTLLIHRAADTLRRPRYRERVARATGAVLLVLGVRSALA